MDANRRQDVLEELEAGFPTALQEKEFLSVNSASARRPTRAQADRMSSARRLLAMLLVCFLVASGLAVAVSPRQFREPCHGDSVDASQAESLPDESAFAKLIGAVSPETLHDLLSRYFPDRYKPGVYPSEHSAIQVVHRANAALATSIVRMARRDGNTTTTPTTTNNPPTTQPTTTPNSPTSPPPQTTPSNPPPETTQAVQPTKTITINVAPPSSAPPSPTNPGTSPGTSTPSGSSVEPVSLSPPSSSPSDAADSISGAGPTESPDASPNQSPSLPPSLKPTTATFTSTLSGTPVVVVATSYVEADGQQGSPTSTRPGGSLQTHNVAVPRNQAPILEALVGAVGAVVGGAMLL